MALKHILEFEKPIVKLEQKIEELRTLPSSGDLREEIRQLQKKARDMRAEIYKNLTRWQKVQIARHPERPTTVDYIENIFDDFTELHGDRCFSDDPAIVAGAAKFNGTSCMIVGHQKGRDTKTNVMRNFGMPNPEGYRKAHRLFELAEKFGKPIITFLDTPGAYPGLEAEERGQAQAIAANLLLMARLKTPILVVVIGEGASGGAIGLGVGDRTLMLENAWYSVISPESCSSILWRSWDFKDKAAEALKLTAQDLKQHNVIDAIVPEPEGGAHADKETMYDIMEKHIARELDKITKIPAARLLKKRREKFAAMGVWREE